MTGMPCCPLHLPRRLPRQPSTPRPPLQLSRQWSAQRSGLQSVAQWVERWEGLSVVPQAVLQEVPLEEQLVAALGQQEALPLREATSWEWLATPSS